MSLSRLLDYFCFFFTNEVKIKDFVNSLLPANSVTEWAKIVKWCHFKIIFFSSTILIFFFVFHPIFCSLNSVSDKGERNFVVSLQIPPLSGFFWKRRGGIWSKFFIRDFLTKKFSGAKRRRKKSGGYLE
jgi:hypothetical protein